jgi:hypothetical protein
MKERDSRRLLRALEKLGYDSLRKKEEKKKAKEAVVHAYRAFITLEDQVGVEQPSPTSERADRGVPDDTVRPPRVQEIVDSSIQAEGFMADTL